MAPMNPSPMQTKPQDNNKALRNLFCTIFIFMPLIITVFPIITESKNKKNVNLLKSTRRYHKPSMILKRVHNNSLNLKSKKGNP